MTARAADDPFRENRALPFRRVLSVLAADVEFRSDDRRLLRLVERAFAGLPRHRWRKGTRIPRLSVTLRLATRARRARRAPSAPRFSSGAGQLFAMVDEANFAIVDPGRRRAFVQVSNDMLAYEYEVRYELIEFATLTLATRAQGLVPLHAACVAVRGRGLLVLGDSGAGKSTFTLMSLIEGLDLLSEDSVFVSPQDGRAAGVANFLHLRSDTVRFAGPEFRDHVRRAPVIERRSGARKHQIDLRRTRARLAAQPIDLVGTLLLSARRARGDKLLTALGRQELTRILRRTQPYAMRHERWREFERRLVATGGYRLERGADPRQGVRAARALVESLASRRSAR